MGDFPQLYSVTKVVWRFFVLLWENKTSFFAINLSMKYQGNHKAHSWQVIIFPWDLIANCDKNMTKFFFYLGYTLAVQCCGFPSSLGGFKVTNPFLCILYSRRVQLVLFCFNLQVTFLLIKNHWYCKAPCYHEFVNEQ